MSRCSKYSCSFWQNPCKPPISTRLINRPVFGKSWVRFLLGIQIFFFVSCSCHVDQFTFHINVHHQWMFRGKTKVFISNLSSIWFSWRLNWFHPQLNGSDMQGWSKDGRWWMHSLPVKINKSGLGSNLARCHMYNVCGLSFVSSCLTPRVFSSGSLVFLPLQNSN